MAILTIDTTDIASEYESLKDYIQTSFDDKFGEAEWYSPMTYEGLRDFIEWSEDPAVAEWMLDMNDALYGIVEIEGVINAVGVRDFESGTELIPVDLFPDYLEEVMPNWGYHIPDFLLVDWEATAMRVVGDYKQVSYRGENYYFLP